MFRMAGMAVLALGVALLVMGSATDSVGSSFSRFYTGNPTDKPIWLMLSGLVCILSGAGGERIETFGIGLHVYFRAGPQRNAVRHFISASFVWSTITRVVRPGVIQTFWRALPQTIV